MKTGEYMRVDHLADQVVDVAGSGKDRGRCVLIRGNVE